MRTLLAVSLLAALLITPLAHAADSKANTAAINNDTVAETLLDTYTSDRDGSFAWQLARTYTDRPGFTGYAINLTSQTWRDETEVSHPEWTHMMQIVRPDSTTSSTALLLIGGERRTETPPDRLNNIFYTMAGLTNSTIVFVPNVPNQPIRLLTRDNPDTKPRWEDDLLAESWITAAETGDPTWIIHLAMVESAAAAMDAAQQFLSTEQGGGLNIEDFVVTGGSKRGWTTWLTAAVDDRVRAIIPLVIDTLNLPATMKHHWEAYGFWAPAIGDYTERRLFESLGSPEGRGLREIVDPYLYRDRLTMPKFLLNSGGDQYFLPDTTRYYLGDLPGETRLRIVPNTDHDIDRNLDAVQSAIAFFQAILADAPLPTVEWSPDADDPSTLRVTTDPFPFEVTLWQATNPSARDFRQATIGNAWTRTPLKPEPDGSYPVRVPEPEAGFTAFLVQARFNIAGVALPLTFTTEVRVTPDVLPHAGKPME